MSDNYPITGYPFEKMEGLGNDFIVMEDLVTRLDLSDEDVRLLCDRHFGIGADGLILLRPATDGLSDFSWHFRNADGSVAEMCGNGIRCLAAYLVDHELIAPGCEQVTIQTATGPRAVQLLHDESGAFCAAGVDMGCAVVLDEALSLSDRKFFCASMGNPHAVTFVDDVASAPVTTLGPTIECDPAFPQKTNVEFAQVIDRAHLRLRVWERGVGETLACGTGACATAVAACCKGLTDAEVRVTLPGGDLRIAVDLTTLQVIMTGSARSVYSGLIRLPSR